MNLLIFSNYQTGVSARLAEEARIRGYTVFITNSLQEAKEIEKKEGGIDIIFPRLSNRLYKESLKVIEYFETRGTFIGVSLEGVRQSFDKFLMYERFMRSGIPTPITQLALENGILQPCNIAFPVILKPVDESQGRGISLARNQNEYNAALKELSKKYDRCIAQSFIAESLGRDIRAFVIGDQVVASIERIGATGSVVSNVSQGGTATPIDISVEEKSLSVKVAQAFGALYAGIDLIRSNTGVLVLEVNLSPGLKIEEITGVPVASLLVEELIKHKELAA